MTKELTPVLWLLFNGVVSIPMDIKSERPATVQEVVQNSGPVEPCVLPYCTN